ncbi:hypothetical protein ACLOAU_21380 [Niabella sp. CJ426]|uniref:hypothetical protein n=1 Tax=Niabella sp. CJ426 TaxID=3393740 RepID=UPI003D02D643
MSNNIEELIILIAWYNTTNEDTISTFTANKQTFIDYNPGVKVFDVINPFIDSPIIGPSIDLAFFRWYLENKSDIFSKRFVLVGWDCWCDCSVNSYFSRVWDCDFVVPSVKYPERDTWHWFYQIRNLPIDVRQYAVGISPFCGIMMSDKAMSLIADEILKPVYQALHSELRLGTIATMLNLDPIVNPVYSRSIGWREPQFGQKYRGFHHPRKTLSS